jgi:RimJ/RimL family protein N-acetyltransferase
MKLDSKTLDGRFVVLEPFAAGLKEEVRTAIDCDPEAWAIMPLNPTGAGFEKFWAEACNAPSNERIAFAIRRRSDSRVVGMTTCYTALADQGGLEIGTTFLHPTARAGKVNPETKMLMLSHAFQSGAVRVQFRVDTRNARSQAAVAKLGAVKEGVLRKDRLTWTGFIRDTVVFSILDTDWPAVRSRLEQRLGQLPPP